jgi:hypothetical protein
VEETDHHKGRDIIGREIMYYVWLSNKGRTKDKIKKIPVGARFFANVQTSLGAHPASCAMSTGYFPGVKRPERGADHPPPSSAEVKK